MPCPASRVPTTNERLGALPGLRCPTHPGLPMVPGVRLVLRTREAEADGEAGCMTRPGDVCGAEFREFHQPSRPRFKNGKLLPAGEGWGDAALEHIEPAPSRGSDKRIDRPARPCARCGRRFQPTERRRMLCNPCFQHAPAGDSPYEGRD